jgi:hypothetical protein
MRRSLATRAQPRCVRVPVVSQHNQGTQASCSDVDAGVTNGGHARSGLRPGSERLAFDGAREPAPSDLPCGSHRVGGLVAFAAELRT